MKNIDAKLQAQAKSDLAELDAIWQGWDGDIESLCEKLQGHNFDADSTEKLFDVNFGVLLATFIQRNGEKIRLSNFIEIWDDPECYYIESTPDEIRQFAGAEEITKTDDEQQSALSAEADKKAAFVCDYLSPLLRAAGLNINNAKYRLHHDSREEIVTITYENGFTRDICVTADSYRAIVQDVLRII